jgi:hypothetical protein
MRTSIRAGPAIAIGISSWGWIGDVGSELRVDIVVEMGHRSRPKHQASGLIFSGDRHVSNKRA